MTLAEPEAAFGAEPPSDDSNNDDERALLFRGFDAIRALLEGDESATGFAEPAKIPALQRLATAFDLSSFEAKVILLGAAFDIDGSIGPLCAVRANDERAPFPTFRLALSLFEDAHWTALSPASPLRHACLVELSGDAGVTAARLRLPESVLHALLGGGLSELGPSLLRRLPRPRLVAPSHAHAIAQLVLRWKGERGAPALLIVGDDADDLESAAAHLGELVPAPLFAVDANALRTIAPDVRLALRLARREVALRGGYLVIHADKEDEAPEGFRLMPALFDTVDAIVLTTTPHRLRRQPGHYGRRVLSVNLPARAAAEVNSRWEDALRGLTLSPGAVARARGQFRLSASGLLAVAQRLRDDAAQEEEQTSLDSFLWHHCRTEAARSRDGLAEAVTTTATWDDLVLPAAQASLLRSLVAQLRSRYRVYEEWGFGSRTGRGLGITALFAGPSGTGKTMAAEVIAAAIGLDLWRIDLSRVVSKWIGETEKNLGRVFDAADAGGAVLLFDEADALFGKRSEVRDSHDRYANFEVSFLLQRMESYRGLAILTTNHEDALDSAFQRRLRTIVTFPFPDATLREALWRRAFPKETPTVGLVPERLARLPFSGGTIRNVALTAAFLAADAGEAVTMAHLKEAAEVESLKLKRPFAARETGDWVCP